MGYSKTFVPNTTIENKIFKGVIGGRYPIKAVPLKIYKDGSLSMLYWYDKVGTPIYLDGSLTNGNLTLVEKGNNGETIANISAKVSNNKIDGFWTNYKTKNKLSLLLEAY